mgnify:CR=1 FL=1
MEFKSQFSGGTTVITIAQDNNAWIAADSRETLFSNTIQQHKVVKKIIVGNSLVYSCGGRYMKYGGDHLLGKYDLVQELKNHIEKYPSIDEALDNFDLFARNKLRQVASYLKEHLIAYYLPQTMFSYRIIELVHGEIGYYYSDFKLKTKGWMEIHIHQHNVIPEFDCLGYCNIACKEWESAKSNKQHTMAEKLQHLIRLEANKNPIWVAEPIDVIHISADCIKWLTPPRS